MTCEGQRLLQDAVLEDLKLALIEVGNGTPATVGHRHVDQDGFGPHAEARGRWGALLRGLLVGREAHADGSSPASSGTPARLAMVVRAPGMAHPIGREAGTANDTAGALASPCFVGLGG